MRNTIILGIVSLLLVSCGTDTEVSQLPEATNTTVIPTKTTEATSIPLTTNTPISKVENVDYLDKLITVDFLNAMQDIELWEFFDEYPWDAGACRLFMYPGGAFYPYENYSCVMSADSTASFQDVIDFTTNAGWLEEDAILLESDINIDNEFSLFGSIHGSGQTKFSLLVLGEGYAYLASQTVFTQPGEDGNARAPNLTYQDYEGMDIILLAIVQEMQ